MTQDKEQETEIADQGAYDDMCEVVGHVGASPEDGSIEVKVAVASIGSSDAYIESVLNTVKVCLFGVILSLLAQQLPYI